MFTFVVKNLLSSSLFHHDPLQKEAKREIRQLANDCCVVIDRLLDQRVFSVALCEDLLSKAQSFSRQAEKFFAAKQYARAKLAAESGNTFIRLAMQLDCLEDPGLFSW